MAVVVNDCDVQLEATSPRTLSTPAPANVVFDPSQVTGLTGFITGTKDVALGASSQIFQIAKTGTISPASITITATAHNIATSPVLTIAPGGGTMSVTPALTGGAFSFTPAQMTTDAVEFLLTVTDATGTYTDTLTVVKLREGSDALTGFLSNENATLPADATSGVVSDYTNAAGVFKVFQGVNDITNLCTFGIASGGNPDSLTYSLVTSGSSGGAYAVTAGFPTGHLTTFLTMTATYGTAVLPQTLTLVKSTAGGSGTSSGTATIFLFQRTATSTAPALPSATVTYTFSSGVAAGVNNGWTQTLPTTGGQYRWMTTATALSAGTSDTIAPSEWAPAAILSSDGTSAFTLTGNSNIQVQGNSVTKISGSAGTNDGRAYSVERYTGGAVISAYVATTAHSYVIGFSTNPGTGTVQFGFDINPGGTGRWRIFNGGVVPTGGDYGTGSVAVGDTFVLKYDGQYVNYSKFTSSGSGGNFAAIYVGPNFSFALDVVIYDVGTTVGPLTFAAGGPAGLNTAAVNLYQRAASAPTIPSLDMYYTFGSHVLTPTPDNGWSQTIPTGTLPIYQTSASASSTQGSGPIAATSWATPIILAQNGLDGAAGANGTNTATVILFQRTSSATPPAVPSATVTYAFVAGTATGVNNGWSQTLPTSGGAYRWITTATATSNTGTDTILTGEWATPSALSSDGAGAFTMTASANASVQGGTVTKISGTGNWDTQAYSNQAFSGGAHASATILDTTHNFAFGLSTNPLATASYTNGWFWRVNAGGTAQAFQDGADTHVSISVAAGDVLSVTYDNVYIRFLKNGSAYYLGGSAGITAPMFLDSSFFDVGAAATLAFGPSGSTGADGINTSEITLYQRSATVPAVPSVDVSYNFSTGVLTGVNNGWSPVFSAGTNPMYVTTATALSASSTDTITTAEWATPVVFVQNGTSAPLLTLSATAQTFTYNSAGTANPSGQVITYTANVVNLPGTVVWRARAYDASGTFLGYGTLTTSGATATLSESQFSANSATVVMTVTAAIVYNSVTYSDVMSTAKVSDGKNAVVGLLSNESATIAAASDGSVASFSGAAGNFYVFEGTANVTTGHGVAYSIASQTSVAMTIDSATGVYSVSSMSADTAFATLQAVYGSVTLQKTFTIAKSRAGINGSNGVNGTNGTGAPPVYYTVAVAGPVSYSNIA